MVNNIKSTDRIVVELEMFQIDFNEQKKKALRQEIANKYGVPLKNVDVVFKPVTTDADGNRISLASDISNNIQNPAHQKNLMKHYIELKQYEDVDWNEIDSIDNQVNAFIDFDQYTKYKNYKFKYVKWSNYLSYGEDNYFDFTGLHGLVLLNSEPANQGGKTTFAIDLLRFALFGKADKSPNLDSVFNSFNKEATKVLVEAGIEIEGDEYVIRRTITRPALSKRTSKSKCKQQLEYFRKTGDELELIENCEGESVQQTNNIIKDAVGSVEDFNLVVSATSYSLGDLLRMGQTDKGRLFSRWLGLLSVEKKEEVAKKIWKDSYSKKLLSNTYNKQTLTDEINDYKVCIDDFKEQIRSANTVLNSANDNLIMYNEKKNDIMAKIKPVVDDLDKVDVTTLDNQTELYNSELSDKRGQFQQLKDEYKTVKDAVFEQEEYDKLASEKDVYTNNINELNISNASLRTEINLLKKDKENLDKLAEAGVCPTCHQKIDLAEHTKLTEGIVARQNELIAKGVSNKTEIDNFTKKINDINESLKKLDACKAAAERKATIELRLTALKTNIENLKLKIDANNKVKEQIRTNEENIKYNSEVRASALVVEESIKNETAIKEAKIREIERNTKNIEINEGQIKTRLDIIAKLDAEEKVIRNWNIYLELVGKNGIVKLVLKDALPVINNEVARILNGLCDFETKLDIDEKNNVVINLVKDGVEMDMGVAASGYEGTVASLALRSALASISSMSKPNFLCVDEVLGQTADCNMENIHEIFNRIMSSYDFILNITHNENIYDWHSQTITVTKKDNISHINFSNN